MMAAAALATGGIVLVLLGRSILHDAKDALLGACGALIGFAGVVSLFGAVLALF